MNCQTLRGFFLAPSAWDNVCSDSPWREREHERNSFPGTALGIVSQGGVVRVRALDLNKDQSLALGSLHLSVSTAIFTCFLICTMGGRVLVTVKDAVNRESSRGLGTEY